MKATGVSLITSVNSPPISFTLRDADPTAQYSIRSIVGLDAEDLVHKFYGTGLVTQPKFYEPGLQARDIVMSISLEPRFHQDESYSDVRDSLYRAISSNRTGMVTLRFDNGGAVIAEIKGFVSKVEATHFVQKPEVQMTISCPDPMFRGTNPTVFKGNTLPLKNPVRVVDGMSTAPHGFHAHMTFTSIQPSLTIQDVPTNPEWTFKIVPSGGFAVGDLLHLETDYTKNHLYIVRGGTQIPLMDSIVPGSIWPVMFYGVNDFYVVENVAGNFPFTWGDWEYYPAYWGV